MAANDYYSSFPGANDASSRPKPPPHTASAQSLPSVSSAPSPFDDTNRYDNHDYSSTAHLTHTQTGTSSAYTDTAYHSADPYSSQAHPYNQRYDSPPAAAQHDPFADNNAIPLQQQGKMGSSHAATSAYQMDPEGRPREKRKKKKKGWFSGRVTWVVYILTTVQIGVFIGELIKNATLTGSPIQIKPRFNFLIGPSNGALITMGARYQPCMHYLQVVIESGISTWQCPNATADVYECSLSEHCGMGGVPEQDPNLTWANRSEFKSTEPNQWWRFITPIFLHGGLIHIGFNMLLQLTLGRDMEKEIGPLRFALVYFASGIFGFVLGGNYAANGVPSTGASGALFGILALVLLDLLYNWKTRRSPVKDLLFLLLDVAIAFLLGLLPILDNFAHMGGFCMGLVLGVCILHSPQVLRERIGVDEPPYATVDQSAGAGPGLQKFVKQPVGFFKGRKPFWWVWWLVRAALLVVVFIGFIMLLRNFYDWRGRCSWCEKMCLPIKTGNTTWCELGNLKAIEEPASPEPTSKPVRLMF